VTETEVGSHRDSAAPASSESARSALQTFLGNHHIRLTNEEMGLLHLDNGSKSKACYSYMKFVFKCIGDHMPNSDEIHLDTMSKQFFYQ
jgi:hypothetical protein